MGTSEQLVTVAAVLLGALTTHLTNYVMERSRYLRELVPRWDNRKFDAYAAYIDAMRTCIFVAVQLYEHKEGILESGRTESEMLAEQSEAGRLRGRAFEQIMLLGGDDVVETAYELNIGSCRRLAGEREDNGHLGGLARTQSCRRQEDQPVP
ncbi:hypothetical protein ACIOHE_14905 [Streptomyces sp. NPDC087851]|uniref:hypothetical protein n=1 Tax=Streptomyces sp. NPDC087851 TaxID=3365810 RepID=UPI00380CB1C4